MRGRRALVTVAVVSCVTLLVTGCSGFRRAIGAAKSSPDEFAIVTKAPLVIPPDFSLKPPAPGTVERATEAELIAQRALGGDPNAFSPTMSAGERDLVSEAGAQYADPLIREVIDQEYAGLLDRDRAFSDRLIFWGSDEPRSTIGVDAPAEARRIEEMRSRQGAPDRIEGQEPATIGKDRSILGGLF